MAGQAHGLGPLVQNVLRLGVLVAEEQCISDYLWREASKNTQGLLLNVFFWEGQLGRGQL